MSWMFWKREKPSRELKSDALDEMLERLLDRFGHLPVPLKFSPEELTLLTDKARDVFKNQPMLVETDAPIRVIDFSHFFSKMG